MTGEAQQPFFSLYGLESRAALPTVMDRNGAWSGGEALAAALAFADWLEAGKLGQEAVMLELASGREWLAVAAGTWFSGRQLIPVNPRWPAALRKSTIQGGLHVTGEICAQIFEGGSLGSPNVHSPGPANHKASVVLYTSGSTGLPRPVIHEADSLAAQADLGAAAVGLRSSSHWLVPMPMAHAGGVGALIRSLHASSAVTLLPDFDVEECLELLESSPSGIPITHVSLVPTMLQRLLDAGLSHRSHLEVALIGGAPLDPDLKARAVSLGIPVRESWGMTETLGLISVCRSEADSGAGSMLDGVEVRVGDESELQVRGPITARGTRDSEGWLHTGDVGSLEGRCVHVSGRLGTVIISGGENVSPERVEAALMSLVEVQDALVYGVPDPAWGERVEAEIQLAAGFNLDSASLRGRLSEILSPWEVPKGFSSVDQIRRNALGKLDRTRNG